MALKGELINGRQSGRGKTTSGDSNDDQPERSIQSPRYRENLSTDRGDPDPLIPVREEIVPGAYRYVFRRRSEISTNKP